MGIHGHIMSISGSCRYRGLFITSTDNAHLVRLTSMVLTASFINSPLNITEYVTKHWRFMVVQYVVLHEFFHDCVKLQQWWSTVCDTTYE
jgi:hypothetical protein